MKTGPAAAAPPVQRWMLLAILTGAYGAGAFGMLGISALSPSLVAGFGLTRLQVAFLVPSIYLAGLVFSLRADDSPTASEPGRACSAA